MIMNIFDDKYLLFRMLQLAGGFIPSDAPLLESDQADIPVPEVRFVNCRIFCCYGPFHLYVPYYFYTVSFQLSQATVLDI